MKSKVLLYGICTIFFVINFVMAGPNHSGWPLEKLSWDIDKAYPGVEYNYRLAIRGGEYPYTFNLIKYPSGMKINSCTGEITWTPALTDTSSKNQIITHIKDLKNNILKDTFVVEVTKKKFYFVAKNGNNSNNGSEASPWATMAYASATADSSSYVYVKKGTYSESGMPIAATNCGRFMVYPGDTVFFNSTSSNRSTIAINGGSKRLFQGFNFNGNGTRWFFMVQGYAKNLIWRNNIMHNNYSNDNENPSSIFFSNGSGNPITGGNSYSNVVIQNNVFYDISGSGCGSVISFDVKNMLYEDNLAYDIGGTGVKDKDMGYMNTIRNNVIHDCIDGIALTSQGGQSGIEVNYNHVYNCSGLSIMFGANVPYINDIFVHHNTLLGTAKFSSILGSANSYNINVFKNIIGNGKSQVYVVPLIKDTATGRYRYVDYFPNSDTEKIQVDSNIVWSVASNIVGPGWGAPVVSWSNWATWGFDKNSILKQLELDLNHTPILPDSLKIYGCYEGHDSMVRLPKNITTQKKIIPENTLSILPNPFSPDKRASEIKSLSQKLGKDAPKGTRISFNLQDEAIKMVKIEILSLAGELVSRIIMQNVLKLTEYHLWWDGRTTAKTEINWEELNPVASDVNGRVMSGDKMCRNGRYFVVLSLQNSNSKEKTYKKQVILIK